MQRICVFCGSNPGAQPAYLAAAQALGALLAAQGIALVYGGARLGLMGALADATLAAGGEVVGVMPEALAAKEIAHTGLSDLRIVGSMHERKALMAELSDAFIALPGGYGTFEELCEILTWGQLGLHHKPCGILNVAAFYDPLLAFFDHAVQERFLRAEHRGLLVIAETSADLLERLQAYRAPDVPKWLDQSET